MTYSASNAKEYAPTEDLSVGNSLQSRLSCLLEGLAPAERNQARTQTLSRLGLLGKESISVFDEATQLAARLTAMPICILSVVDTDVQHFKSVVGLSNLGLMNQLAASRSLPLKESLCTHVIDSEKTFPLEDARTHPAFSRSLLVQQYGIQSYIGVPLVTSDGCCIGTLALMDLAPRTFSSQEVALLELTARWSISEFEKQEAIKSLHQGTAFPPSSQSSSNGSSASLLSKVNQARFDLVVQLTHDLRNPLTSITGMASMLSREIYGPLSEKQQEYAKIVLSSSQQLLGMVDEILEVGDLEEENYQLSLANVDIEMVGQQAIAALGELAEQQELKIKLTVEPGSRIWNLDKRVVKQLIYHLVFSVIKMSTAGSTIRLHVSRKGENVNIALWVSNPWLGEDLPQSIISWSRSNFLGHLSQASPDVPTAISEKSQFQTSTLYNNFKGDSEVIQTLSAAQKVDTSRQELGLLLSRHLTEVHGGSSSVQGSAATGYRYVISLPSAVQSH